jgi:hypothetical protein
MTITNDLSRLAEKANSIYNSVTTNNNSITMVSLNSLKANGTIGSNGQVLISNGAISYWVSKFYAGNVSVIPVNPSYGDVWYSTDDNKPYMWINTGTYNTWYDFLPV